MSLHDGLLPYPQLMLPPTGTGPLAGMRFAVKDLIDIAGQCTGGGNPDWRAVAPVASEHAPVVAALLAAGASCVGKTITDELAFSLEGVNAHYGTPVNPVQAGWLPGGSSSGSAVAVASGAVDFALGTDTGGSVRVPAAFCRIFGFRPSHGALCLTGVLPFAASYDTVGWLARDAHTLAQVGDVLLPAAVAPAIVAISLAGDVLAQLDGAVADDVAAAAASLVTTGPVNILGGATLAELQQAYATVQGYEIQQALGARLAAIRPILGSAIAERFAGAMAITPEQYRAACAARTRLATHIAAACRPGTAIIVPVVSVRQIGRDGAMNLDDFYGKTLGLNAIAGHGGLPQVQLGIRSAGDAIGIALLSARHSDRALLALARQIEEQRA